MDLYSEKKKHLPSKDKPIKNGKSKLVFLVLIFIIISGISISITTFPSLRPNRNIHYQDTSQNNQINDSILWSFNQGLMGNSPTIQPRLVNLTEGGESFILLGSDSGISLIDVDGCLVFNYETQGEVLDFEVIGDISQDGQKDIALVVLDQIHPNVLVIDSNKSEVLWTINPKATSFDPQTSKKREYTTQSWDIKVVGDINQNNFTDLAFSSWKNIYVVDGKDGSVIWENEKTFSDDVWTLEVLDSLIIGGSQAGEIVALDLLSGVEKWRFEIPKTEYIIDYWGGKEEMKLPNSVDEMLKVKDIDGDKISDLLISSDDGFLRILSGKTGILLSEKEIYQVDKGKRELRNVPSYRYSIEERFFGLSGFRIVSIPDINEDNNPDYLTLVSNLDYTENDDNSIHLDVVSILNGEIRKIFNISLNATNFSPSSYPTVIKKEGNIQMYMSLVNQIGEIFLYQHIINTSKSKLVQKFSFKTNHDHVSEDALDFLLPVYDFNSEGNNELFFLSKTNKYLLYDLKINKTIWEHVSRPLEFDYSKINDVTGNGIEDILYEQFISFQPEWKDDGQESDEKLISELIAINSKSGKVVWRFTNPNPNIYDGLKDLRNIGDLTGDNVSDYASWIIPSRIPEEVSKIIEEIEKNAATDLGSFSEKEQIYRYLLKDYTKFLIINGATGEIFWETPITEFPYDFYRQYGYNGSYYSNGNDYYLRTLNEDPSRWGDSYETVLWESDWDVSSLTHPQNMTVNYGENILGNYSDLSKSEGNVTLNSEELLGENKWITSFNLEFPVNFDKDNRLGLMSYPLSQMDRFSAFNLQSMLAVNTTIDSVWYNFTYEIYNESSSEWVLCDWNETEEYWSENFTDYHGGFGENRSNYDFFNFSESYSRDDMYVQLRGTHYKDNGYFLDFENKTKLSDFITSNDSLVFRINITNGNEPFQVTMKTFNIGLFYWDLFRQDYDEYYILQNNNYTNVNILDLEVGDFEIINGTGDNFLDALFVIGGEDDNINNRLTLINPKDQEISTRWTLNGSYLPESHASVLIVNNSLNNLIMSGVYRNKNPFYGHKLIDDIDWSDTLSHFEHYGDSETKIPFKWILNSTVEGEFTLEKPGIIKISEQGKLGVIVGKYNGTNSVRSLKVMDPGSLNVISSIPFENLIRRIKSKNPRNFEDLEENYLIKKGIFDLNKDNYFDFAGLYTYEYNGKKGTSLRIYNGQGNNSLLLELKAPKIYPNKVKRQMRDSGDSYIGVPFVALNDKNLDGTSKGYVGIQASFGNLGAEILVTDEFPRESIDLKEIGDNIILESLNYRDYEDLEYVQDMGIIEDMTGDSIDEIYVKRNHITKVSHESGASYHFDTVGKYYEILDAIKRKILFRLNFNVNSAKSIGDINRDNRKELLIASDQTLYCLNSQFKIKFVNIKENQTLSSNSLISWATNYTSESYKVYIDDLLYTSTVNTSCRLNIGSGAHNLKIIMEDNLGLIQSIDNVKIYIKEQYSYYIFLIGIGGLIAGLYIFLHRRTEKKNQEILYEPMKKEVRNNSF